MADFTFVTYRLATGAAVNSDGDVQDLIAGGITHIVDLRGEFDDASLLATRPQISYLWNGVPDDGNPATHGDAWFAKSLGFVLPALARPGTKAYAHCFPTGTLVGGSIPSPIESAQLVTGHDGALHKVLERMERPYEGDLTIIHSTGALPLRCTPEHPVLVVRPYRFPGGDIAKPGTPTWRGVMSVVEHYRTQPEWVEAGQVRPGDFLVAPRPQCGDDPVEVLWPKRAHKNNPPVGPLEPDPDTAWMLGLYAADGSTTGQNGIGFTVARQEEVDRLTAIWHRMGVTVRLEEHENHTRVGIVNRTISAAMQAWCGKSDTKRLPGFVFDGWPLADVIEGYVAGDGHLDKRGRIACTTISPILAEQIRMALLAIGESPTMNRLRRHSGYPNARPGMSIRWSPGATQRHTAWWRGLYLMPVTSIEAEHYRGTVHNLEVQDAHTYTVGGATVHNCAAGVNRGPSTAFAVMLALGFTAANAEAIIRAARPQVGLAYRQQAIDSVARLGYV